VGETASSLARLVEAQKEFYTAAKISLTEQMQKKGAFQTLKLNPRVDDEMLAKAEDDDGEGNTKRSKRLFCCSLYCIIFLFSFFFC
jgi:hypothetical protein